MLFTSDDNLRQMQRASARMPKGMTLSPEQQRIEAMEADRELREHRRWRQFAFLLFIVPALSSIIVAVMGWIAIHVAMSNLSAASSFLR